MDILHYDMADEHWPLDGDTSLECPDDCDCPRCVEPVIEVLDKREAHALLRAFGQPERVASTAFCRQLARRPL
jgi:hypothetical protein